MTKIPDHLWQAYKATSFEASLPSTPVAIRVGDRCPVLDQELQLRSLESWAFITASNPGSKGLSEAENMQRHDELIQAIEDLTYPFFAGEGVPADTSWKAETSLLVLGISKHEAIATGKRFGQFAIVVGKRGQPAELVVCD